MVDRKKKRLQTSSTPRSYSISPPPARRKLQSATTSQAVDNFFKPASKKDPDKLKWSVVENTLLCVRYMHDRQTTLQRRGSTKRCIAGFDLDDTLIRTKGKHRFTQDEFDWQWWHPTVPETLKRLDDEGFQIVIFTNQGGISLKQDPKTVKGDLKRLKVFKEKISILLQQLDLPISLYAATERDRYRKPRTGMWEAMLNDYDLDMAESVNVGGCFYVGDAGGRPLSGGFIADHACSDRDLAANIGINFQTPEEFFLHEAPRTFTRSFDPKDFLEINNGNESATFTFEKPSRPELVLFCGSPGSGKSSVYWRYFEPLGYQRVNQDILKTRERCIAAAIDYLESGESIVIDNTNASKEVRRKWLGLARKYDVPVRCVYFTAPAIVCQHNDSVRALGGALMNPEQRTILPAVAFRGYTSRFEEPQLTEGFKDIVTVPFQFEGDEAQREIWSKYWL